MKNALLLTILAGFLISGVRAQNPSYFSMEAARERENREREEEKEREDDNNIVRNLFGHPLRMLNHP